MMMWTPVEGEENLPKKSGNYLVTTEIVNPVSGKKLYDTKTAFFTQKSWVVHEVDECIPGEVIAWKELELPYGQGVQHVCKNCMYWYRNNLHSSEKTKCPWRNNDVPTPYDFCSSWKNKEEKR